MKVFKRLKTVSKRKVNFKTREEWLTEFVKFMRPIFRSHKKPLPKKIRISCGFPRACRNAIGQCWSAKASEDKSREIFVSPTVSNPSRVCDIVIHELIHAALPDGTKHGSKFRDLAIALGLTGKMTATVASPELVEALDIFIPAYLGKYPHSRLSEASYGEKQSTRLIKLSCDNCGMVIRTTRKWIEETGAPKCACGGEFEQDQ